MGLLPFGMFLKHKVMKNIYGKNNCIMFALLLDDHNYNERTNIYGLYKSLFRVNTNYPLQYDKTKSPANDKTKLLQYQS